MFYCVLEDTNVTWYSGMISFPITNEDIRIMYEDTFERDFQDSFKIIKIDDMSIANQIMKNKATYDEVNGWLFTSHDEQSSLLIQVNLEEELFQTQTELLQTQLDNNELGSQLFDLQTQLITKGVL